MLRHITTGLLALRGLKKHTAAYADFSKGLAPGQQA